MKWTFIYLLILFGVSEVSILEQIREVFPQVNSVEEADLWLKKLDTEEGIMVDAYKASLLFVKSRYVKFPLTKLKYFKRGKKQLDGLIKENPDNIEMRYIRFLFQKQMPRFLGYHTSIEEDFKVIVSTIENSKINKDFKKHMLLNILESEKLSNEELKEVNRLIKEL
jgi:hypothetical protein